MSLRTWLGCAVVTSTVILDNSLLAKQLVVQLDWHLNSQFAGLLVAERDGLYRDAGLDVKIKPLGDVSYASLARVVAETDGMIGSIEGGLFLASRLEGVPIIAIGTMLQASPLGLISLEASGIKSPADLAGRHVAVHGDGHEALNTVLTGAGLDRTKLRVSEAAYGMADLLSGKFDAKQGYLVDEFVKLKMEGHHVTALEYRTYGHRAYSQVYFVSERTLNARRSDLQKFLRASAEGWRRAAMDPAATAIFIHETHAKDLKPDYLEQSLRLIVPLLTAEQSLMGAMQMETWKAQALAIGKTSPKMDLDEIDSWIDFSMIKTEK